MTTIIIDKIYNSEKAFNIFVFSFIKIKNQFLLYKKRIITPKYNVRLHILCEN